MNVRVNAVLISGSYFRDMKLGSVFTSSKFSNSYLGSVVIILTSTPRLRQLMLVYLLYSRLINLGAQE